MRGRQEWVSGLYDTESKLGYMVFVDKRDADTLLPIIERAVLPGRVIITDEWRANSRIAPIPNSDYIFTVLSIIASSS